MRNVVPNNGEKERSFWIDSENTNAVKKMNPLTLWTFWAGWTRIEFLFFFRKKKIGWKRTSLTFWEFPLYMSMNWSYCKTGILLTPESRKWESVSITASVPTQATHIHIFPQLFLFHNGSNLKSCIVHDLLPGKKIVTFNLPMLLFWENNVYI